MSREPVFFQKQSSLMTFEYPCFQLVQTKIEPRQNKLIICFHSKQQSPKDIGDQAASCIPNATLAIAHNSLNFALEIYPLNLVTPSSI